MNTKRLIAFFLSLLMALSVFTGCSQQASESKINPDLMYVLGDLIDEDAERGIHKIMDTLQSAYDTYQKDHDIGEFAESVDSLLSSCEDFLEELSDEINSRAKEETDKDKKAKLSSLSLAYSRYSMSSLGWYTILFDLEMGEHVSAEEIEEALYEMINALSRLLYAKTICPE